VNGYTEIPTRQKAQGTVDKLVAVEAMADIYAHDREFAEFVLHKIAGAGSAADAQAAAWCKYVEGLPYRREPSEVLRDPKQTAVKGHGGDCDDLVVALLAGLKSLAIPCQAEIFSGEDGWAFHIRGRVGLPPLAPQMWVVVDPVWQSERQWAMANRQAADNALLKHSQCVSPSHLAGSGSSMQSSSTLTSKTWLLLLGVFSLLWIKPKWLTSSR